ncbi:MAG: hypothetical protein R3332_02135 [Pseudohongiellaceae bacterium]|nr:hypothetical protein [Pseudohongiellaceae bacterium]
MDTKEKRQASSDVSIDPQLIEQGTAQLAGEIELLKNWIEEIEQSGDASPEALDALSAYKDMLSSRNEMLSALLRQYNKPD